MAKNSNIEWTDATWNPWYGCNKVSPGCKHCYAERDMNRFDMNFSQVKRSKTKFDEPLKWDKPLEVFTCSWSDFFHGDADRWRTEAWDIIKNTPHFYRILTKRPENILDRLPKDWGDGYPNVMLVVSIENHDYVQRGYMLSRVPAQYRGISAEPLIGELDLLDLLANSQFNEVIVGGESGMKNSRPCHPLWINKIRLHCEIAQVPFFFKQWGAWLPINSDDFPMEFDPTPVSKIKRMLSLHPTGKTSDNAELTFPWIPMAKIGKQAAGRRFLGRIWDNKLNWRQ